MDREPDSPDPLNERSDSDLPADVLPADAPGAFHGSAWGSHVTLATDAQCRITRLVLAPGLHMAMQRHQRREHWYVISGQSDVEVDGCPLHLGPGQSLDLPAMTWHTLHNSGHQDFVVLQIATGPGFAADDVEYLHGSTGLRWSTPGSRHGK